MHVFVINHSLLVVHNVRPINDFFFMDTTTTEIYTLSLHDALPIYPPRKVWLGRPIVHRRYGDAAVGIDRPVSRANGRSEEHTSELQSLTNLVFRLLLEKKNIICYSFIVIHHGDDNSDLLLAINLFE